MKVQVSMTSSLPVQSTWWRSRWAWLVVYLSKVHDEGPGEHDPPAHRSVNVPEPEGEEEAVEGLVPHLAPQVEQQVPQVVPYLNKRK